MDPTQYREALRILGLTNTTAAAWLGVTPRSCQMWASGRTAIPGPVAKALRLACGVRGLERYDVGDSVNDEPRAGYYVRHADVIQLLARPQWTEEEAKRMRGYADIAPLLAVGEGGG